MNTVYTIEIVIMGWRLKYLICNWTFERDYIETKIITIIIKLKNRAKKKECAAGSSAILKAVK